MLTESISASTLLTWCPEAKRIPSFAIICPVCSGSRTIDGGIGLREGPSWFVERIGAATFLSASLVPVIRSSASVASQPQLDQRPNSAVVETLQWIKHATGLSWERIAEMLQVSRQAVDRWAKGGPINDNNRKHLLAVRDVLERAAVRHTPPDDLAVWLDTPRGTDGRTPADLLAAGEIDRACLLAVTTPSPGVKAAASWARPRTAASPQEGEQRMEPSHLEPDDEPMPG